MPAVPPPRKSRKAWCLPGVSGGWVVIRSLDASPDDELLRDPPGLRSYLRRCLSDTFGERTLQALCRELWSAGPAAGAAWAVLLPRLEAEFRRGALLLARPARAAGSGGASLARAIPEPTPHDETARASRDSSAQSGRSRKTWVAIRLIAADGRPVPNQPYRVVLPDGAVEEGSLNGSGEAWLENVDPGECRITFPDLDGREWRAA